MHFSGKKPILVAIFNICLEATFYFWEHSVFCGHVRNVKKLVWFSPGGTKGPPSAPPLKYEEYIIFCLFVMCGCLQDEAQNFGIDPESPFSTGQLRRRKKTLQ